MNNRKRNVQIKFRVVGDGEGQVGVGLGKVPAGRRRCRADWR